jgi:2-(3-amino-3-carboxypropyl)histidine synthase
LGVHKPDLLRCVRRYDPYGRVLTRERYDQGGMRQVRRAAVEAARGAGSWGLVLGTLGRQGNPRILAHLQQLLTQRGIPYTNVRLPSLALHASPACLLP